MWLDERSPVLLLLPLPSRLVRTRSGLLCETLKCLIVGRESTQAAFPSVPPSSLCFIVQLTAQHAMYSLSGVEPSDSDPHSDFISPLATSLVTHNFQPFKE